MQCGTPPCEALNKDNNQPHIVHFVGDVNVHVYVAIEQEIAFECSSMTNAVFTMLAVHFFNLEHNHRVNGCALSH